MYAIGLFLSLFAAICWLGFFMMRYKSGRIANTPLVATGTAASERRKAAGDKDAISVEGRFFHDQLLTSPVTNTPCVYYELSVVAKWKSGDSEKTVPISSEKNSINVGVDDGSGPVSVDLRTGGDFDGAKKFDKTKGAIFGGAKFGDSGYTLHPGARYNGVHIPDNAKFQVKETALEPPQQVYVCGRIDDDGVIGSPKFASLIVSNKSREELLGATMKQMKIVGAVGGALAVLGPGLVGLSAIFASPAVAIDPVHVDALAQSATGSVLAIDPNERIEDTVERHLPSSLAPLVDLPKRAHDMSLDGSFTHMQAPRGARVSRRWHSGYTALRGVKPEVVLYTHNPAGDDEEDCPTLDQVEARLDDADITASQRVSVAWTGEGPAYGDEIDLLLFEREGRAGFYVRKRFDHGDDYTDLCAAFGSPKSAFDMTDLGSVSEAREMAGSLLTARENL